MTQITSKGTQAFGTVFKCVSCDFQTSGITKKSDPKKVFCPRCDSIFVWCPACEEFLSSAVKGGKLYCGQCGEKIPVQNMNLANQREKRGRS
jgi:transcription elongation factor Elf1